MGPDGWGPWRLADRDAVIYVLNEDGSELYAVDLDDCGSSAQMLAWIFQVANKSWADSVVVAGLVRALDDLFEPQATLCSNGRSTRLSRSALASRVRAFREGRSPYNKPPQTRDLTNGARLHVQRHRRWSKIEVDRDALVDRLHRQRRSAEVHIPDEIVAAIDKCNDLGLECLRMLGVEQTIIISGGNRWLDLYVPENLTDVAAEAMEQAEATGSSHQLHELADQLQREKDQLQVQRPHRSDW